MGKGDSSRDEEVFGRPIVDLDHTLPRPEAGTARLSARPRRQCATCFTNRSSILTRELKGHEERALRALRRAHPEEYEEHLRREQIAAEEAATKSWNQHTAGECQKHDDDDDPW